MSPFEKLQTQFPVRKTKKQKAAFRTWMLEECRRMGYAAAADEKGFSRNIVIGDPESAKVVFTAHYDTQPILPFPNMITPKNIGFYILVQMPMVLCMLLPAALISAAVGFLTKDADLAYLIGYLCFLVLFALLLFGPANPHCANDNTSGVAAVMEIMSRIPEEQRNKAAFILFDNEELGMLGSSSYAHKHPSIKKERLLINMDCVGDGENILFFANKATRALPEYADLTAAMEAQSGRALLMNDMEKSVYPSDQASYKLGIAVCACLKGPRIGYYFDKIHTIKDTVCDQGNLDFIANGLADFVERLA